VACEFGLRYVRRGRRFLFYDGKAIRSGILEAILYTYVAVVLRGNDLVSMKISTSRETLTPSPRHYSIRDKARTEMAKDISIFIPVESSIRSSTSSSTVQEVASSHTSSPNPERLRPPSPVQPLHLRNHRHSLLPSSIHTLDLTHPPTQKPETHYFASNTSSALCLLGVLVRINISGLSSPGIGNVPSVFSRICALIVVAGRCYTTHTTYPSVVISSSWKIPLRVRWCVLTTNLPASVVSGHHKS
jgi:hypothetical protein